MWWVGCQKKTSGQVGLPASGEVDCWNEDVGCETGTDLTCRSNGPFVRHKATEEGAKRAKTDRAVHCSVGTKAAAK